MPCLPRLWLSKSWKYWKMIFKWLEILGNHKMAEVNSLKQLMSRNRILKHLRNIISQISWIFLINRIIVVSNSRRPFRTQTPKTKLFVKIVNPFSTNAPLLYSLKTSENFQFSDVFRGYRSGTLIENGLMGIFRENT